MKGIIKDLTNENYHAEKEHLSSSNYKLLLDDPIDFYEQKILGKRQIVTPSRQKAYDEGTYAHSLILEPETIPNDFVFFEGMRKSGPEWTSFKNTHENSGKIMFSKPQKKRVENWVRTYEDMPEAVDLLKGCDPELSLFAEFNGIPSKCRADAINIEEGYIVDVKTCAYPCDFDSFKMTVQNLKYDLSAALYTAMFSEHFKKDFDFYWVVLGKTTLECQIFKMSSNTYLKGISNLSKACKVYKACKESNSWKKGSSKKIKYTNYEILEI